MVEAALFREEAREPEAESLFRATIRLAQRDEEPRASGADAVHASLSAADAVVAHSLRRYREQSDALGLYYAARGLGDLLEAQARAAGAQARAAEAQARAAEAMTVLLTALRLAPTDVPLTEQLIHVAQVANSAEAVHTLERHLQRLQPHGAHAATLPPHVPPSYPAPYRPAPGRQPVVASTAPAVPVARAAAPPAYHSSVTAARRTKGRSWADRLAESRAERGPGRARPAE